MLSSHIKCFSHNVRCSAVQARVCAANVVAVRTVYRNCWRRAGGDHKCLQTSVRDILFCARLDGWDLLILEDGVSLYSSKSHEKQKLTSTTATC